MAYDGTVLKAVIHELNEKLNTGRIDKIYQPEKDEITLSIRCKGEKYKLLLSASSNNPRVYLTNIDKNNPQTPPTFCMLLRKHLESARIINFEQYKMDRVLKMNVISKNELGDEITKSLIVEIMGKYSNIILIDNSNNKIYDSIKRVNSQMSRVREILPGLQYDIESISDKEDPLIETQENFINILKNSEQNKSLKNFIMNTYTGISPNISREISYRASIESDRPLNSLTNEEIHSLSKAFLDFTKSLNNNEYKANFVMENDKIISFSALDLLMYPENEKTYFKSISSLLDEYYSKKDNDQRMKDKSSNIKKVVKNNLDKNIKKLEKQNEELNEATNREKYKIYADLISANLYKIEKGQKSIEVENFYDNMNLIKVPLDERFSGSENANRYYKKYSKLKHAAKRLELEIEKSKSNIDYLETVLLNIEFSDEVSDIEEIKEELKETGFIKKTKSKTKNKKKESKFLEFKSIDGYKIYVGKNNKQNEELTLKIASKEDMWFHVKGGAGSHVIIKNNGEELSEEAINECATLAAYYSSFKNSNNVEIDYTTRKNIKRHPSKVPGLVIYVDFSTINVSNIFNNIKNIKKDA
ncbi:Rqc2 family fibronectin-binding protein [Peptoniphilus stercorisuis]|uniref:Rqc2 homolog RqcH n=1 Tax=Peptoniphilus stercorisuis TaxID=1436965 RepID=A0ABS4KBX3_9FIRM|nr:NFACT RNA binding domain-containing protein [Peptoniphilus stercorisuis]MBP2025267.1 putative ribosome quality control (RQC) complex YloA/Tae2 family protein [Peptoniphilus stercorisuis]